MEHTTTPSSDPARPVFVGDSEMAARCRALDWAATPLGAVAEWPDPLQSLVRTCLESPFAINLWCGPELVLIYNDAYRRVLGAKHPDALGKPGARVWSEVWQTLGPMFDGIRAGGPPVFAEDARFVTQRAGGPDASGADSWFTFSLSPVRDDAGAIVAFLNVVSETTKRIEAEGEAERLMAELALEKSRLEFVFRQAPAFLAVLRGPQHVFELVNDAYYQLVGHRPLLGKPAFDAMPELRDQGYQQLLDQVLRTGEPYIGMELPVQVQRTPGAPAEERFVNLVYLPLVQSDGKPSGVIAHGSDVTDQVRARKEVERLLGDSERARVEAERARAEADSANRAKSEFLATMSHEFRTPLNAIIGYAQLLDMGVLGPATPAQQEHLERLQASARHLLRLVDDVLDVAKVDADRLEVRRDIMLTTPAVVAALALLQPQATARGIRISDLGADGPGARYIGDEHRVRQILVNLLSNAVKFTPVGGEIAISCGLTTEPAPGAMLHRREHEHAHHHTETGDETPWAFIEVRDTGPGMTPELVGSLFEPFVQGDNALTRQQGGTGLGLAISRRLARLMGGDLTVRSRVGEGTAFTVWLPGAPVTHADEGRTVTPPEAPDARRSETPADAMVALRSAQSSTLSDAAYAVLHALGVRIAADAETISERYVAAMRADGEFPGVSELPTVQLRDHATPAVGLIATQLMVIGETRGRAPELLADGGKVQRLIDELHGVQRHRLGWSEADLEREVGLLTAEIERGITAAVDTEATAGATSDVSTPEGEGTEISSSAVDDASNYATTLVRQLLERGTRTALRTYRFARAEEGR